MGNFFGGYTASALRSVLVVVILAPLAVALGKLGPLHWKQNWHYFLGLIITAALIWGPLYFAILNAGVGMSLAINYACIVLGMFFFGWLMAGERMTKAKWLSAMLGIGGLALVFSPSFASVGWLALGAATVSGFANAAHIVIAKKMPFNATQTTLLVWLSSVVANIPMAFILGEHLPAIGWHVEWLYLGIFAVASIAASWTIMRGIKLMDAGIAGILGLSEIVFALVFGVIFFREQPGLVSLLGVGVIIAAAVVPYLPRSKRKH